MKGLLTFLIILGGLFLQGSEKNKPDFHVQPDGKVLTGGHEYQHLSAYFSSEYFQKSGKRCLVKWRHAPEERRGLVMGSANDCSLTQTVIRNQYWTTNTYLIPIVFHVIRKSDGTGNLSDQQIQEQVEALNEDYRALSGTMGAQGFDTRIQFELAGITRTVNDQWFKDEDEMQYKSALAWDPNHYLNVYTNEAGGYLGYSYMPQDGVADVFDGVVLLYEIVGGRNGTYDPYNQGRTLVHEVGHYLGLLHTFEGDGCYDGYQAGDLIADTDSEEGEHYGCSDPFTCDTPDNIHNYMNYTDDDCMWEFTREQANRLVCALLNYRPHLYTFYTEQSQIILNRTRLNFTASGSQTVTGPQTVRINRSGSGAFHWTVSPSAAWITCTPSSGTGNATIDVSVNGAGLNAGNYSGTVTITAPGMVNSPQQVTVYLNITAPGTDAPPIGEFSSPSDGASVRGSIALTGWALDDIQVENVKIYNGFSYIGDATLVDDTRPDVETAYPNYPKSYCAGWGYMLLTPTLPNGGNGTYTLTAKATDRSGNVTTLGSKTISVDNAHAVNPFGALETPAPGGVASGKEFVVWGWALTPAPNAIPTDGSTITVWVDGVSVGHPVYNIFRSDIAALFPGLTNSNGALGYFYLNTTAYTNGIHTIQWTVTDNAGNTEGIGSRYFMVLN
ncbi:MAG: M43 family zinc metalloprotease [Candidatus Omnitrophota bacterium]